jgi:hypothetical protein
MNSGHEQKLSNGGVVTQAVGSIAAAAVLWALSTWGHTILQAFFLAECGLLGSGLVVVSVDWLITTRSRNTAESSNGGRSRSAGQAVGARV